MDPYQEQLHNFTDYQFTSRLEKFSSYGICDSNEERYKITNSLLERNNSSKEEHITPFRIEDAQSNRSNPFILNENGSKRFSSEMNLERTYRELQEQRIHNNIAVSQNKEEEYRFLLHNERVFQKHLYEINHELLMNELPKQPTWLQRQYTFFTGLKSKYNLQYDRHFYLCNEQDRLERLLEDIELQLIVYESFFYPIN